MQMRETLQISEHQARMACYWYPSILAVRPERLSAVIAAVSGALQLDHTATVALLAKNPQTFGVPPEQVRIQG